MSTENKSIAELLPALMREVGAIGKNRRNSHQNYQFRGIDDVLNHVGPPCAALGIRVSPTIHDYVSTISEWDEGGKRKFQVRTTLRMRLEFVAPDGSSHVAEGIGEANDTNGDKASNKAMSAAFKYACFMGLVIPVEGALDDSDNDPKADDRPAAKPAPAKWQDYMVTFGKSTKDKTLAEIAASPKGEDTLIAMLKYMEEHLKPDSPPDDVCAINFVKQAIESLL